MLLGDHALHCQLSLSLSVSKHKPSLLRSVQKHRLIVLRVRTCHRILFQVVDCPDRLFMVIMKMCFSIQLCSHDYKAHYYLSLRHSTSFFSNVNQGNYYNNNKNMAEKSLTVVGIFFSIGGFRSESEQPIYSQGGGFGFILLYFSVSFCVLISLSLCPLSGGKRSLNMSEEHKVILGNAKL